MRPGLGLPPGTAMPPSRGLTPRTAMLPVLALAPRAYPGLVPRVLRSIAASRAAPEAMPGRAASLVVASTPLAREASPGRD
jgi:hypothetical protein